MFNGSNNINQGKVAVCVCILSLPVYMTLYLRSDLFSFYVCVSCMVGGSFDRTLDHLKIDIILVMACLAVNRSGNVITMPILVRRGQQFKMKTQ